MGVKKVLYKTKLTVITTERFEHRFDKQSLENSMAFAAKLGDPK